MNLMQRAQAWWADVFADEDGPLDGDAPAWAMSLAIHVVVLLGLALAGLAEPPKAVRNVTVIEAPLAAEEEVQLVPQEITVSDERQETEGAESDQSDSVAQALAPTLSEISVVSVEAEPDLASDLTLQVVDDLPTAQEIDASVTVKGSVGVGTTAGLV
jgi:hypothetical protein